MITAAAGTAVQAFICCCLDYCNSLLYGMSDGLFLKILSIQNPAARLVTGTRRCDHITLVLRQLHWLSVRPRVDDNIACLVHQSLAGQIPAYLADDIQLGRTLIAVRYVSAAVRTCFVPQTHNSFRDQSFSAAGLRVWNSLPPHLSQDMNFAHFKHTLKTFLFGC